MKLKEIFSMLATGEFSQLSIGGQDRGVINASNYKHVVGHLNLGLTALFTRFSLKEGRIVVAHQPGVYDYPLTSGHARSARRPTSPQYILDSAAAPFKDDIIKITGVLTLMDREMSLNKTSDPWSASTPTLTTLRLPELVVDIDQLKTPYWLRTDKSTVVYQANHPQIVIPVGYFDPNTVNLELPPSHLQALLYFVASRANNPMGMTDNMHSGNNYYVKYEQACRDLESKGIENDTNGQENKIVRGGWA